MKRLIIDSLTNKIKVVFEEDGELSNVTILDREKPTLVGNIYLGRVDKIVNKTFCFIDIGLKKNVFLDISDNREFLLRNQKVKQGDRVLVEVIKDETVDKCALCTSQINYWQSGFIVILKTENKEVRVSRSIYDKAERKRLRTLGLKIFDEYSIVFRTASEVIPSEEIEKEYRTLVERVRVLEKRVEHMKPPCMVFNNSYTKEMLNYCHKADEIYVNNKEIHDNLVSVLPNREITFQEGVLVNYSMNKEISKLFNKKVWLKSGGFLYIEETESAVLIDVNSGKMKSTKDRENTILKANIEALETSFHEIKLRNLSGIILIDLISYKNKENTDFLIKTAKDIAAIDHTKMNIVGITDLCLMQITRKKELESLTNSNTEPCPYCNGQGRVYDTSFLCDRIFREVYWFAVNTNKTEVTVKCNEHIKRAFDNEYSYLIKSLEDNNNLKVIFLVVVNFDYNYYEVL